MMRIGLTAVVCALIFSLFALNWNSTTRLDFYFYRFESVSSMVIAAGGFLIGVLFTLGLVLTRKITRGFRMNSRKGGPSAEPVPPAQSAPAGEKERE